MANERDPRLEDENVGRKSEEDIVGTSQDSDPEDVEGMEEDNDEEEDVEEEDLES